MGGPFFHGKDGVKIPAQIHAVAGFDWTAHTLDGCHPNAAGHDWLAEQVAKAIQQL